MSWKPEFGLLIAGITVINYFCATKIEAVKEGNIKKWLLFIGIILSLAPLFYFKYFNFLFKNIYSVINIGGWDASFSPWEIILPVGISFITFQALSYSIDVYRGNVTVEKRPERVFLFISFFPQLVAGPIERAGHLLPQLLMPTKPNFQRFVSGFGLIIWGLFKKVAVAEWLALYVDTIFNNLHYHSGLSMVIALYFFSFQIYCDFSAYSDIAIGSARLFGVDLIENFNKPYLANSLQDFWRRWHISLTRWFKDYVYIPLGGSRGRESKTLRNLLLVFLLSALWHGASWTFIMWGAYHVCLLIVERFLLMKRLEASLNPLYSFINKIVVFNLVSFGWLFFRANSTGDILYVIQNIYKGWPSFFNHHLSLTYGFLGIVIVSFIEIFKLDEYLLLKKEISSKVLRYMFFYLFPLFLLFLIILVGVEEGSQFIYFQF